MKVYFKTQPHLGKVMWRIETAFKKYSPPSVEWTDNIDEADLEIVHMIGLGEVADIHADPLEKCKHKPKLKNYVVLFHCFDDAGVHIPEWETIFKKAALTYSFHPLDKIYPKLKFNFLFGPWGVDPETFYDTKTLPRNFMILTTGYVSGSECIYEAYKAAKKLDTPMIHIGGDIAPEVKKYLDPKFFIRKEHISDFEMNLCYNQCKFVNGLRRNEGFEVPVLEGILAGCRPVCFDNPYYTRWFKNIALFIKEDDKVEESLYKIFKKFECPVTEKEKKYVADNFNWQKIITNIFNKLGG